MTHEQLMALMGHDEDVRFTLLVQRSFGLQLQTPPGTTPGERYAEDIALVEGRREPVSASSAEFLTSFERHLDHRLSLESAAVAGDPHALHRLHVQG